MHNYAAHFMFTVFAYALKNYNQRQFELAKNTRIVRVVIDICFAMIYIRLLVKIKRLVTLQ